MQIGPAELEKKNLSRILHKRYTYTLIGSDDHDGMDGFLKFGTLDLENGLGWTSWTSWTSWTGPGTKFLAFLSHSKDISKIQISKIQICGSIQFPMAKF